MAVGPARAWMSAGLTVVPVGIFGKRSKMTRIFQIACFSIPRPPSPPSSDLTLNRTLKCVRNKKVKV